MQVVGFVAFLDLHLRGSLFGWILMAGYMMGEYMAGFFPRVFQRHPRGFSRGCRSHSRLAMYLPFCRRLRRMTGYNIKNKSKTIEKRFGIVIPGAIVFVMFVLSDVHAPSSNASNYAPPAAPIIPRKAPIIHLQRLQLYTPNGSNSTLLPFQSDCKQPMHAPTPPCTKA